MAEAGVKAMPTFQVSGRNCFEGIVPICRIEYSPLLRKVEGSSACKSMLSKVCHGVARAVVA